MASTCFGLDYWIGGNYTYMKLVPEDLASFGGNLGGIQAGLECKAKDAVYQGAIFLWREGNLDGEGSLQRNIFNVDTQVRLGYTTSFKSDFAATLFTGFGWEYIGQRLTGGGAPLELNYNEVYIPVGLLMNYKINRFSIGLNGIWMPQIFPTVNFVPLDNARWVTACTLANFLVELPLAYRFCRDCWKGFIELRPFFEYWQDGETLAKSSTGTPLGLVSNTYYIGGAEINLGAEF